jgi:hypothetical protein
MNYRKIRSIIEQISFPNSVWCILAENGQAFLAQMTDEDVSFLAPQETCPEGCFAILCFKREEDIRLLRESGGCQPIRRSVKDLHQRARVLGAAGLLLLGDGQLRFLEVPPRSDAPLPPIPFA